MLKKFFAITVLCGLFTSNSHAAVINASAYFNDLISSSNTSQNATNMWQLGYLQSGNFTLFDYTASGNVVGSDTNTEQAKFDSYDATATAGLSTPLNNSYYGFGINVSGTDANYFGNPITKDEIYAHPADNSDGDVILRFFTSTDGVFDFNTLIRKAHSGIVEASVWQNSTLLASQLTSAGPFNFIQQLSLNAGDTVDFVIDSHDGWGGDGTAINANVSSVSVPEPSTVAMFFTVLLSMSLIRKKA